MNEQERIALDAELKEINEAVMASQNRMAGLRGHEGTEELFDVMDKLSAEMQRMEENLRRLMDTKDVEGEE